MGDSTKQLTERYKIIQICKVINTSIRFLEPGKKYSMRSSLLAQRREERLDRLICRTTVNMRFRARSYGKKLSRFARKHFDKVRSEMSPSYENSMES